MQVNNICIVDKILPCKKLVGVRKGKTSLLVTIARSTACSYYCPAVGVSALPDWLTGLIVSIADYSFEFGRISCLLSLPRSLIKVNGTFSLLLYLPLFANCWLSAKRTSKAHTAHTGLGTGGAAVNAVMQAFLYIVVLNQWQRRTV